MSDIRSYFSTRIYKAALYGAPSPDALEATCYATAEDDVAGQDWSAAHGFPGYTSYASLTDLPWRNPLFADLVKVLDAHVAAFIKDLDFDLDGQSVELEDIWINILPEGGSHSGHIHPHSVISGTTYVAMPDGTSAIRFEDPRHTMMMAAPLRAKSARDELKPFIYVAPKAGDVILWESWLRHEVPVNMSEDDRISISFNYALK